MLPSRSKSLSGPSSGPKGPVLIEGLLEKKKTFGSSKFFCSLHDGKLWYSEDKGRESLIDISHAQSVREGKAKFSFEIITSSRTHTFVADSQSTRDKWVASLREVMRVSSRKNSTLSYIESANSDEETGASSDPRSSIASQRAPGVKPLNSPTNPLQPGFGASLPVGLSMRTTPSVTPPLKDGITHPSRTKSEMKSSNESVSASRTTEAPTNKPSFESTEQEASKGDCNRAMSSVQAAAVSGGANKEIKEEDSTHVTLSRDGEKEEAERPRVPSSTISEENESGELSKDDSGENTRQFKSEAEDDSSVATEIVSMSPNSLYANNADIKKFLYEQSMEEDQAESISASEETKSQMERNKESINEPELQSPKDASDRNRDNTDEEEEEEEEADDVFPCNQSEQKEKTEEVKPPPMPVLRRPSHPAISVIVEPPEAEPAAVELDVDFCREPIPNLPHPCLEENWSSAFVEMRAILSSNSTAKKENSALTYIFKEQQQGCAVDSLKHFLKNIECG